MPSQWMIETCQKLRDSIPGTKILQYIDQSSNPVLSSALVQNQFKRAAEGVCSAMTAEWIRINLSTTNTAKAIEEFGKLLVLDFQRLVQIQDLEMRRLDERQKLVKNAVEATEKAETMTETVQGTGFGMIRALFSKPTVQQTNQQVRLANALQRIVRDASDAEHRSGSGGLGAGTPAGDGSILKLKQTLPGQTQLDGYYRLSLSPLIPGTGHVIGLHKTAGKCRLMDPNTCEWETANHADLCQLMHKHIKTFYVFDFFAGSYSLLRYMDAPSDNSLFTDPDEDGSTLTELFK